MRLRRLEIQDWHKMFEWMQDTDINQYFRFDASSVSKEEVINFINTSLIDRTNLHLAIVDDTDEYLGTISLKNISLENDNAEYAISLRKKAVGTGIAKNATDTILYIAFFELNLNKVYLNVLSKNIRATRFYQKYGFCFEGEFINHLKIRDEYHNLKWFGKLKKDFIIENLKYLDQISKQYEEIF